MNSYFSISLHNHFANELVVHIITSIEKAMASYAPVHVVHGWPHHSRVEPQVEIAS